MGEIFIIDEYNALLMQVPGQVAEGTVLVGVNFGDTFDQTFV